MGAKGEALARQFEAKAREAAHVLEKLSEADWKKVTEAEKWSVGVTAHHLASSYERVPDIDFGRFRTRCVGLNDIGDVFEIHNSKVLSAES